MGLRVGGLGQKTDGARRWGPLAFEDVGRGEEWVLATRGFPRCEVSATCFHFPRCLQLSVWN